MTSSEWMTKVRDNEQDLLNLIRDWHPVSRITNHRGTEFVAVDGDLIEINKPAMTITAPNVERVCANVRKHIIKNEAGKADPTDRFKEAMANSDVSSIMSLLSSAWFGVPESTDCWQIPGFSTACDLMDDPPETNGNFD